MVLYPIPRSLFPSHFSSAGPSSRLLSTAADHYLSLLQSSPNPSGPILEITLTSTLSRSASRLDLSTVESVLHRSTAAAADRSLILRFFVWADLQPTYRHSTGTYSKASELLQISRHPQSLDHLLDTYREEGAPVSSRSFKVLFNLCREANLPGQAQRLLRRMGDFNCRPDTSSYNAVLRLLLTRGSNVDLAEQLLQEMALCGVHPDMVTYVSLVKGFCDANRFEDARALMTRMRGGGVHGCVPNVVVYSALLDGACKCGDLEAAMKLLEEMESETAASGCAPNVVTYTCLIQCLCEKGRVKEAMGVLDRMGKQGCCPNRVTVSALLRGICREGCIDEAFELIERVVMMDQSLSSEECYSSLVACLLGIGNVEEAENLVRRMLASGVRLDGLSRNCLIRELCSRGRCLDGFTWVSEMWREGLSLDSDAYSLLVVGLCEEGHLVKAVTVVRGMVERGVQIGSTSLDGLVELLNRSGETDLALQIMRFRGS